MTAECVVMPDPLQQQLTEMCRARLPRETCGILLGEHTETCTRIDSFALVRNAAPDPERGFFFDPGDWVQACYEAQKNQRNIVGFFHSHPHGSPAPSVRDAAGRLPWGVYLIFALTERDSVLRFYR